MARLLDPSAFGLLAMASVTLNFGNQFSKMGMAQVIVQKKDLRTVDIRSVFTTSTMLGVLFFLVFYFTAPLFNHVYNTEEIVPLIQLMSITFILRGLSVTSLSMLGKNLEFKKLAIFDITSYVICNMGIGIGLALNGFGVYSLIIAGISQQLFFLILAYFNVRHNIMPFYNWKVYKPLLSYGGKVSIIGFLEFIVQQLDTFLIARFFGATKTGLYSKARIIVMLPTYNLTVSLSKVIFPALSQLQDNKEKLRKAYTSSITIVSAFLFPICIGIFAASEEIVLVLLGDKWVESIPLLAILSFAAPFNLLSHFGGILCDATANLNKKFVFQVFHLILIGTLFYLFKGYGLIAFPVIILIGEIFRNVLYIFITKNIISVSIFYILKTYFSGILIGTLVFLGIYSITTMLNILQATLIVKFIFQFITGLVLLLIFGFVKPIGPLKRVLIERSKDFPVINFKGKNILLYIGWYKNSMVDLSSED